MYEFRDTNEALEGAILPSEALQINGEFIENLIEGYRTLNVTGREALSPELATYETGIRDGSKLQNKRYPARTIIVKYQLISKSNEAFREAYNKLASILNVKDAQLIFNDEQDKFFTGTPSTIGQVEPGKNAVVGEFEILCVDPFKYSVLEYEAKPDLEDGSILIDYNGTYKAYPTLEADFYNESEVSEDGESQTPLTGSGDCGYVAFFNEKEKIIQLGDPEEVDTESYEMAQTLINQKLNNQFGWGSAAQALWATNGSNLTWSHIQQTGSVAIAPASYIYPSIPSTSATILNIVCKTEAPNVVYKVVATASGRTADTVKVSAVVTASLEKSSNYFGKGFGLKVSVKLGGDWYSAMIKQTNVRWSGTTAHKVTITATVEGLEADTTKLTDIAFKAERTDDGGKTGVLDETKCSNLEISAYTAPVPETYYLNALDYGTAINKWHGPSITREIPADAAGEAGAVNWSLSYKQKMSIGNVTNSQIQLGAFQALIGADDGTIIAGLRIAKENNGKAANMYFYVNGKDKGNVGKIKIDLSFNNKYFGNISAATAAAALGAGLVVATDTTSITKTGNTVVFNCCGLIKVFKDNAITSKKATKITFMFESYSVNPPLSHNGLYSVKFMKNNCDTYKDIPNKFSANDIVTADCKNGTILLNNLETPSLGALGNDWEEFYLTPGINQIGYSYSSWVDKEYAPNVKVRYRECFL